MTKEQFLEGVSHLFGAQGVFRKGHFVLTSEEHSDVYFNKRVISSDDVLLAEATELLYWLVINKVKASARSIDTIASPEEGAIPFGYELSKLMTARFGTPIHYVTLYKDGNGGFKVRPSEKKLVDGKRIALVEDIFTTGGSTEAALKAVLASGGMVHYVLGLLDQSHTRAHDRIWPTPLYALRTVDASKWTFEKCKSEGPCSREVEICTEQKVGHGFEHVEKHGQPPYAT